MLGRWRMSLPNRLRWIDLIHRYDASGIRVQGLRFKDLQSWNAFKCIFWIFVEYFVGWWRSWPVCRHFKRRNVWRWIPIHLKSKSASSPWTVCSLIKSLRFCFLSVALTMYSELQPFQLEAPIIFASFQGESNVCGHTYCEHLQLYRQVLAIGYDLELSHLVKSVNYEDCHFKLQNRSWDAEGIRGQSEDSLSSKWPHRPSYWT